jgi:hypothetical protein
MGDFHNAAQGAGSPPLCNGEIFRMFCISGKRCTKQEYYIINNYYFSENDRKYTKRPACVLHGYITVKNN